MADVLMIHGGIGLDIYMISRNKIGITLIIFQLEILEQNLLLIGVIICRPGCQDYGLRRWQVVSASDKGLGGLISSTSISYPQIAVVGSTTLMSFQLSCQPHFFPLGMVKGLHKQVIMFPALYIIEILCPVYSATEK
jgi:hypothetical protein